MCNGEDIEACELVGRVIVILKMYGYFISQSMELDEICSSFVTGILWLVLRCL